MSIGLGMRRSGFEQGSLSLLLNLPENTGLGRYSQPPSENNLFSQVPVTVGVSAGN
jgi:hypothetical protein